MTTKNYTSFTHEYYVYIFSDTDPFYNGDGQYHGLNGCEAAYEAYRAACEFCKLTGGRCELIDGNTGEILEYFGFEDEDEDNADLGECLEESFFDDTEDENKEEDDEEALFRLIFPH